jgi:hypothetical protein
MDDPKYLPEFWWSALDPKSRTDFPTGKIDESERLSAETALREAKQNGSFDGVPERVFAELAQKAGQAHPFKTFIAVPVRRSFLAWLRMPSYLNIRWQKIGAYAFWIAFLVLTVVGLASAPRAPRLLMLLLPQLLGRAVLPFLSSLAIEPRYVLEALPVCFIFAAIGISNMESLFTRESG